MQITNNSLSVFKQANGLYRWTATSTNNIRDRDRETLSLKALQADVARSKMFGDEASWLRFYHIPFDIGGAPDFRALVDGMLVESGEFYDEPVAKAVAEYIINNPDGLDGSGWGTSIGFMGVPDHSGVYHSALIYERSVLPLSKAANAYTSFGVKEKMLRPDQQQALDKVVGDPALLEIVRATLSAQDQSKMAAEAGAVRKMAEGDAPITFAKAGNYTATPVPQNVLGFGQTGGTGVQVQTKDAAENTEAVAAAAAQANVDVAAQALANVQSALSDVAAASTTEEAAEVVAPVEAAPVAGETKAEDKPADAAGAKPEDKPTEAAKPAGLSDADMEGIAKYVNECVTKAVGAAMAEVKAMMQGEVQKMRTEVNGVAQVKAANELAGGTYERLKQFGVWGEPGIKPGSEGFVEKDKNLPAAPDSNGNLKELFGFGEERK